VGGGNSLLRRLEREAVHVQLLAWSGKPKVGAELAAGYAAVGNIQPGDIICAAGLPGWPVMNGNAYQGRHADLITAVEVANGQAPTLDTKVRLLDASWEPTANKPANLKVKYTEQEWTIRDLLNPQKAPLTEGKLQFVIRSYDFGAFDQMTLP